MPVLPVVLARGTPRTFGLLGRCSLGEGSGLALTRAATVLQQLLQLGDAGIAPTQRLNQLSDPSRLRFDQLPKGSDLGDQPRKGGTVVTRGGVARRNSPRYARPSLKGWTPLSKYVLTRLTCLGILFGRVPIGFAP